MNEDRGFASKIGFIMTMAAFCIGIGNMWKFPYVVGANGGGAFLLVYLFCIFMIGIPVFAMEVTLGRSSELSPIKGMKVLDNGKKKWTALGWIETIAISCIEIFSGTVIGGWSLGYVWKTLTGELSGKTPDEIANVFGVFSGSWGSLVFTLINAVILFLCLNGGIKKGVEKVCSILMPTLLVCLVILAIYSNTLEGALEGLKWYLIPDFSKITVEVFGAAATQTYFSVGIGMLVAFVYGSYIKKDVGLPGSLSLTAIMDTFVAFMAGLIVTPALFAYNMEPTAGPSLIFVTLPQLFNEMGAFGRIFGTLFMLCVYAAGFSSMLGGAEGLVADFVDGSEGKLSRKNAAIIAVVGMTILAIPVTRSFAGGFWGNLHFAFGFGLFDTLDFISSGVCMPIAAVLIYIFCMWKWGTKKFGEEVNAGTENGGFKFGNAIMFYCKYILPFFLIFTVYAVVHAYGVW